MSSEGPVTIKMVDHCLPPNLQQTQPLNLERLSSFPNQNTQLQDWSMVVVRHGHNNNDCSVFPPINHENLQVFSQPHQHHHHHVQIPESPSSCSTSYCSSSPSSSSSSASSSLSPSDADNWGPASSSSFDSRVRKGGDFVGLMSIGLEILRSKLFALVTSFRNYASHRGAIFSTGPALVMSCWIIVRIWCWLRRRRMKRSLTPNEDRLINIIREKDGRIAQLLHQIAQMNEILIDRHKALAAKLVE